MKEGRQEGKKGKEGRKVKEGRNTITCLWYPHKKNVFFNATFFGGLGRKVKEIKKKMNEGTKEDKSREGRNEGRKTDEGRNTRTNERMNEGR